MTKVTKDNGVICGTCEVKFSDNDKYLAHRCKITGHTPQDPEHFGSRFITQSKKALERTKSLTPEINQDLDVKLKKVKDDNIDDKIMRSKLK